MTGDIKSSSDEIESENLSLLRLHNLSVWLQADTEQYRVKKD